MKSSPAQAGTAGRNNMSGTILSTRMMRRVALVLCCSALLPALLAVALRGAASAIVLTAALIAAFACAALGSIYLARQYVPALRALRLALEAFPQHRPETMACAASDEPAALLDLAARRAGQLRQRLRSLEACAEIDQLLIGSSGLEQILEALIARVQSVMHCHGVSITLRDTDAPGRGRAYISVAGLAQLPVSRVALDADMLARLFLRQARRDQ